MAVLPPPLQVLRQEPLELEPRGMWDVLRRGASQVLFSDLAEVPISSQLLFIHYYHVNRWGKVEALRCKSGTVEIWTFYGQSLYHSVGSLLFIIERLVDRLTLNMDDRKRDDPLTFVKLFFDKTCW